MNEAEKTSAYNLADDDKVVPLMVYTDHYMIWGDVIIKQAVRVSIWLRTQAAPDTLCLHNAKMILIASGITPNPTPVTQIFIKTSEIKAYHILPPQTEPLDYDPNDKNSHLVPIIGLVSTFRMEGTVWMSLHTDLSRFLDIARENYLSLYNAKISCSILPTLGTIQVPHVLIRRTTASFAQS
jgi:hypothetical protein